MTVTVKTNKTRVNGDGAVVDFTFTFPVQNASDLVVKKIVNATEVATLQNSPADYTVALNIVTEGGTVTYTTAPLATEDSFIKRLLDLDQGTRLPTESNFPEVTIENEIDRSRMIDIQIDEEIDRSIAFAETSLLSNIAAPEGTSADNRKLKIWGWDSDGTGLTLYTATIIDAVSVITTKGDLVQGSDAGVAERLAIGATGSIPIVTAGKLAYLAIGATNKVLTVSGGTGVWGDHVPINYRSGLKCKRTSATTMTVEGGVIDVDGTLIEKTADTILTLTLTTDWVDDTSDQAVSSYGFIYINATGKMEMDNVAPDESDTSGNTSGTLRYNDTGTDTTDRRIIGGFYMNATGAGELDEAGVWTEDANGGGESSMFSVHKAGTDQTGVVTNTWTKVTWQGSDFETSNDFASHKFTPTVAGKFHLTGMAQLNALADAQSVTLVLYKNGSEHKFGALSNNGVATNAQSMFSVIVDANGTGDYFEAWLLHTHGSDGTIEGDTVRTYFQGYRIAE